MGKQADFDKEKAVELYKKGITPTEIGRQLNVGYGSIIWHLKKEGIYVPTGTRKKRSSSTEDTSNKTQIKKSSKVTRVRTITDKLAEMDKGKSKPATTEGRETSKRKTEAKKLETKGTKVKKPTSKKTESKKSKSKQVDSGQKIVKQKKKPANRTSKQSGFVSMEEKIAYCNAKYGEGNWYFMSRQELYEALLCDNSLMHMH